MINAGLIRMISGGAMVVIASLLFSQPASAADGGHQFVADVNGDGHADAVTVDVKTGDWWAAMSNGTDGFQGPSRWISGFGVRTSKQFVADVTGDGKADAVTFDRTTGDWWVAPSSGSTFTVPSRWMNGHGVGSANQLVGDINGDGKADSVVVFTSSGVWSVGESSGAYFNPGPNIWHGNYGAGSSDHFVADVTGDGKADTIVAYGSCGSNNGVYTCYKSDPPTRN